MNLVERLAIENDTKILLVVLDGLGGVPRERKTELEAAWKPNLDRLAATSSLGLTVPIAIGITPGSGPAHLALFGYDPLANEVPRGVLEGLGVGLEMEPGDVLARGNFATLNADGTIASRRAGRLPTEQTRELCARIQEAVPRLEDVEVTVRPGREHRFVVKFSGTGLESGLTDSDPQVDGRTPLEISPTTPAAAKSARLANEFIARCLRLLAGEERANCVLLRGIGTAPHLESMTERYKLGAACVAAYPMYRGLARLVGMSVLDSDGSWESEIQTLRANYADFDFFYLHVKETDRTGEDGDFDGKVEMIERFDEEVVPQLLELRPDVLCITGDHSTPAVLEGHSWHSVPLLVHGRYSRPQVQIDEFGERACARGNLGYVRAQDVMALLLANALRLRKFGA